MRFIAFQTWSAVRGAETNITRAPQAELMGPNQTQLDQIISKSLTIHLQ